MGCDLCIIDDAFMAPAVACGIERYGSYTGAGLNILMQQKNGWEREQMVHNLCSRVIEDIDEAQGSPRWILRAFSNPEFFVNAFDNENYRSDIIIFDWEYTAEIDQVAYLKHILCTTHALVFVYSQQDTVKLKSITDEHLDEYNQRLCIIDKSPEESYSVLLGRAKEMQAQNFSFKFGRELRTVTNKSLDEIFRRLGDMDFGKVIDCLISQNSDDSSAVVDSELKGIISSKIKDTLKESPELHAFFERKEISAEISHELLELTSETIKNNITATCNFFDTQTFTLEPPVGPLPFEELWSYRLYHIPRIEDKKIRTGDLIRERGTNNDVLFFVLNGDCDLQRFWKKCGGVLVLVELLNISAMTPEIRMRSGSIASLNADFRNKITLISSFSNGNGSKAIAGAPICIPYVPLREDNIHADYLIYPLRISSHEVEVPSIGEIKLDAKKLAVLSVAYEHTNFERICSINEPFAAPLKWSILSQLYGWGSPDYPAALQQNLKDKIKGIFQ